MGAAYYYRFTIKTIRIQAKKFICRNVRHRENAYEWMAMSFTSYSGRKVSSLLILHTCIKTASVLFSLDGGKLSLRHMKEVFHCSKKK